MPSLGGWWSDLRVESTIWGLQRKGYVAYETDLDLKSWALTLD